MPQDPVRPEYVTLKTPRQQRRALFSRFAQNVTPQLMLHRSEDVDVQIAELTQDFDDDDRASLVSSYEELQRKQALVDKAKQVPYELALLAEQGREIQKTLPGQGFMESLGRGLGETAAAPLKGLRELMHGFPERSTIQETWAKSFPERNKRVNQDIRELAESGLMSEEIQTHYQDYQSVMEQLGEEPSTLSQTGEMIGSVLAFLGTGGAATAGARAGLAKLGLTARTGMKGALTGIAAEGLGFGGLGAISHGAGEFLPSAAMGATMGAVGKAARGPLAALLQKAPGTKNVLSRFLGRAAGHQASFVAGSLAHQAAAGEAGAIPLTDELTSVPQLTVAALLGLLPGPKKPAARKKTGLEPLVKDAKVEAPKLKAKPKMPGVVGEQPGGQRAKLPNVVRRMKGEPQRMKLPAKPETKPEPVKSRGLAKLMPETSLQRVKIPGKPQPKPSPPSLERQPPPRASTRRLPSRLEPRPEARAAGVSLPSESAKKVKSTGDVRGTERKLVEEAKAFRETRGKQAAEYALEAWQHRRGVVPESAKARSKEARNFDAIMRKAGVESPGYEALRKAQTERFKPLVAPAQKAVERALKAHPEVSATGQRHAVDHVVNSLGAIQEGGSPNVMAGREIAVKRVENVLKRRRGFTGDARVEAEAFVDKVEQESGLKSEPRYKRVLAEQVFSQPEHIPTKSSQAAAEELGLKRKEPRVPKDVQEKAERHDWDSAMQEVRLVDVETVDAATAVELTAKPGMREVKASAAEVEMFRAYEQAIDLPNTARQLAEALNVSPTNASLKIQGTFLKRFEKEGLAEKADVPVPSGYMEVLRLTAKGREMLESLEAWRKANNLPLNRQQDFLSPGSEVSLPEGFVVLMNALPIDQILKAASAALAGSRMVFFSVGTDRREEPRSQHGVRALPVERGLGHDRSQGDSARVEDDRGDVASVQAL